MANTSKVPCIVLGHAPDGTRTTAQTEIDRSEIPALLGPAGYIAPEDQADGQ